MLEGTTETFRLALKVVVDPAYEQDAVLSSVEAALRDAYSFDARGLGEPVFRSEIVATRTPSPASSASTSTASTPARRRTSPTA